jgi:hypothetical protein
MIFVLQENAKKVMPRLFQCSSYIKIGCTEIYGLLIGGNLNFSLTFLLAS